MGGGGGGEKERKKPSLFYPFQRLPRRLTKLCTDVQYVATFVNYYWDQIHATFSRKTKKIIYK